MMIWIILIAITLAVMGVLSFFLLRKQEGAAKRVDYDIIVYRDQIAEVGKDRERGLLTQEQADAAHSEIYRRMLAAEDVENNIVSTELEKTTSLRSKLIPALFVLTLLPLGTWITYLYLGSPELPAKPYSARASQPEFEMAKEAEQLSVQLQKKPDVDGYKRLADIYFTIKLYDKAADTYEQVIQMNGENPNIWSKLGETLVLAHDDLVVPEARQAFVKALRLDHHDARARFYLGLAETQINESRRAVAIWRDLEKDSKADAPWLPMLKEHIASFSKEGGFDPTTVAPAYPSLISPHDIFKNDVKKGSDMSTMPTGDAASAIMALPPSDQNDAIHTMVDRLADKMKNNPDDLDGWQRLATSYRVLGETAKAEAAENKIAALKSKGKAEP